MVKLCLILLLISTVAASAQDKKTVYEKRLKRLIMVDLRRNKSGKPYSIASAVADICKQAKVPFLYKDSLKHCKNRAITKLKAPPLKNLGTAKKMINFVVHPNGYKYIVTDKGLYIKYAPSEVMGIEKLKIKEEKAREEARAKKKQKLQAKRIREEAERKKKQQEQATQNTIWMTDFEQAKIIAARSNRPILANFTGSDWCGWCMRLNREVFSQEEFQNYALANLICLKVDFPKRTTLPPTLIRQNERLAQKYKIRGYPTILLLDSNERLIGRTGYKKGGALNYVNHLKWILRKH